VSNPLVDTSERPLERVLALVLLAGVIVSAGLVGAGLAAALFVGWDGAVLGLRPLDMAQAGLLVLIATPVFRVGVSIVGFARERDWLYVALAGVVLALLAVSLIALR
jgi:uncharacterized membrane protein